LPALGKPGLAHYAKGVDVAIFPKRTCTPPRARGL
jgi:hypothetical protein